MGRPWGLSGPEFLWLYSGLLLLPALVSFLWWHGQRRRYQSRDVSPPLSVYQQAWLAGGGTRAAETVIARLVQSGDLRVNSLGFLTKVAETSGDRLEKSALTASHNVHWARAVDTLRGTPATTDMGNGLVLNGLLMPPKATRQRLRVIRLLYVAMLALGVIRWINGVSQGYPIGYLTIMLVVCAIALVVMSVQLKRSMARRTVLGDRALAEQRSAVTVGGTAGADDAAALVAVGGLSAYPDPEIRSALTTKRPPSDPGGGGSPLFLGGYHHSGSCSSGFAGCSSGGGSGCGGGGGGCGGGGS